ncbi:MAG TPA: cupredoxin domain-containing protein [Patescibacteria group bacterium]|jgi:plastocyanin|nr:cupredoxin domain-containing protein [Patescibacteria group bacterium]
MKRVLQGLALAGLAAMTVACSSGGSSNTPAPTAAASGDTSSPAAGGTTVVAKDIAYQPTSLTIPAATATAITFDNQDAAPHNIAIKDASGAQVFKGEIVTQTKVTYNVDALPAGTYGFWCEVHPNMTGTLTVQ